MIEKPRGGGGDGPSRRNREVNKLSVANRIGLSFFSAVSGVQSTGSVDSSAHTKVPPAHTLRYHEARAVSHREPGHEPHKHEADTGPEEPLEIELDPHPEPAPDPHPDQDPLSLRKPLDQRKRRR